MRKLINFVATLAGLIATVFVIYFCVTGAMYLSELNKLTSIDYLLGIVVSLAAARVSDYLISG